MKTHLFMSVSKDASNSTSVILEDVTTCAFLHISSELIKYNRSAAKHQDLPFYKKASCH